MKVEELISEYKQANKMKKEYGFSQHIVRRYMPYAEKTTLVKAVIKATSYKKVGEIEFYERNTSSMLFVFTMKLIEKYTDIEIDVENINADYDALMESGTMNGLMSQIPEEEISILRGMLDMERDDLEVNTRSLISFFESKTEALRLALDSLNKVLERPEIQAKIEEFTK